MPKMIGAKDLTGETFGRWTVIGRDATKDNKENFFLCRCSCGNPAVGSIRRSSLVSGGSQSCGCGTRDAVSAAKKTHGKKHSPEYRTWVGMKQRCLNTKHDAYHNYGGRGIGICRRWLDSFEDFLADMGTRPTIKYTLDRIDGSKNYEPGNCRWATPTEQARNKRTNTFVTMQGSTRTISEWMEIGHSLYSIIRTLNEELATLRGEY